MAHKSLTQFCFETLAKEIKLERITGLEDIEQVKLLSGEEGGGINFTRGTKLIKFPWLTLNTRAVFPFPIMTMLFRWG